MCDSLSNVTWHFPSLYLSMLFDGGFGIQLLVLEGERRSRTSDLKMLITICIRLRKFSSIHVTFTVFVGFLWGLLVLF